MTPQEGAAVNGSANGPRQRAIREAAAPSAPLAFWYGLVAGLAVSIPAWFVLFAVWEWL